MGHEKLVIVDDVRYIVNTSTGDIKLEQSMRLDAYNIFTNAGHRSKIISQAQKLNVSNANIVIGNKKIKLSTLSEEHNNMDKKAETNQDPKIRLMELFMKSDRSADESK